MVFKILKKTTLIYPAILALVSSQVLAENNHFEDDYNEPSSLKVPAIVPLGDSASNLSIVNNSGTSKTINGLIIDKYSCTNSTCSSGCTNIATSSVVLWNPVTMPDGSSQSVGMNYLYNLLTILNNARQGSTISPCSTISSGRYIHIAITVTTPPQGNSSFTANGTGACLQLLSASNCNNSAAIWNPSGTINVV